MKQFWFVRLTTERENVEVLVWVKDDEVGSEHDACSASLIVVHLTGSVARTPIRHDSRAVATFQDVWVD